MSRRRPSGPDDRRGAPFVSRCGTVALVAALLAGCGTVGPPPAELRGRWTSEHPRYDARVLVIADTELRFGRSDAAEGDEIAHEIRGLRSEGGATIIEYGPRGRSYELGVRLREDGSLSFVNQPDVVWRRRSRSR